MLQLCCGLSSPEHRKNAPQLKGDTTDFPTNMGNVNANGESPTTSCSPIFNSEKKQAPTENLTVKEHSLPTSAQKYKESGSGNLITSSSELINNNGLKTVYVPSPAPLAPADKVRVTKDVNHSRSNSKSNTPTPTRTKTAAYPAQTGDHHRSSSNGSLKDSQAKDIMISYSHSDKEIMLKLKEALEAHNISVWVDFVGLNAGVDFLNKIGQAIIDSKMFITLLTERTVKSKFCQDELALAYISNKPIFPVSILPQSEIFPKIPTGMKLQLARFEWTQISLDTLEADVGLLLKKLKACLDDIDGVKDEHLDGLPPLSPAGEEGPLKRKPVLRKRHTRPKLYNRSNRSLSRCNSIIEQTEDIDALAEFWDRNFKDQQTVLFDNFEAAFMKDYERQLTMTYGTSTDREWFIDILKRELEVEEDGLIHKDKYKEFITEDCDGTMKEQPILKCVNDLAVENYTMKEVFNMDSSVRLDAINNLAKFGSVAVVEALLDLLDDQEHDVRASACISLAKSKAGDLDMKIDRLMKCLKDKDRFVRESACIALGYLKANTAVPALLQIWRNDYISSVRDAAELALQQIGGDEVNRAMKMTKVLTAEIQELIKVLTGRTSPKNPARQNKPWGYKTLPTNFGSTAPTALTLSPAPHRNPTDLESGALYDI
ncbi:uncharacterized protein [Watersipora subatra]|uniref:uncharacterized protein isoform X2 n=1 Tax=Watersipora subatra TaxID=2589382 RepID=UPI00355BA99F